MINKIIHHLINEGLLIEGVPVSANFFYFRNTNIQLFSGDAKFFHIKIGDGYPLAKEFEAINQAWRLYPEFAPKPISLIEIDGINISILEGVKHEAVTTADLRSVPSGIFDGIRSFFAQTRTAIHTSNTDARRNQVLSETIERFKNQPFGKHLERLLENENPEFLLALPRVAQHGDFAGANLGQRDGKLKCFDWEDFGYVDFAGFDLCILIMWMCGFSADVLEKNLHGAEPTAEKKLLRSYAETFGLDQNSLRRLLPIFAGIFLHMKYEFDYGPNIKSKILDFMNRYFQLFENR